MEERLEKLEKELIRGRKFNRWLLAGLGLIIGAWIAGWNPGAETAATQSTEAVSREIRARLFIVEDDKGRTRAMLGTFEDGSELQLSDENGNPRAVLIASKDESELQLQANGVTHAWMHASNRGSLLQLNDENGHYRLGLHVFKDGPKLVLYDDTMTTSGKPRIELDASKDGPKVQLYDAKGRSLWKVP
jgi:hypothetical protein